MPIRFDIDLQRKRIYAIAEGIVNYADIEEHLSQENGIGGLRFPELIDGRRAQVKLSSGDMRQVAGLLRGLGLNFLLGATAVVVADDYAFGLVAMLEMFLADACAIRPFRDVTAARIWLGWEPEENPPA